MARMFEAAGSGVEEDTSFKIARRPPFTPERYRPDALPVSRCDRAATNIVKMSADPFREACYEQKSSHRRQCCTLKLITLGVSKHEHEPGERRWKSQKTTTRGLAIGKRQPKKRVRDESTRR